MWLNGLCYVIVYAILLLFDWVVFLWLFISPGDWWRKKAGCCSGEKWIEITSSGIS